MGNITDEVLEAQQNSKNLNQLISKYLPFIKKQITRMQGIHLEYDDMLSIAMVTFSGCVQQYAPEKGNFFGFCGVCIKNRLLDESRKQLRYEHKVIPLIDDTDQDQPQDSDSKASIAMYNTQQEQQCLAQEIETFSNEIKQFSINFNDLPRISPKQKRSRHLCQKLANEIVSTPSLYKELMVHQRIAQAQLSIRFHISPKTIEKHRKYIVTLVLLMSGDYPYIQSFLPNFKEVI